MFVFTFYYRIYETFCENNSIESSGIYFLANMILITLLLSIFTLPFAWFVQYVVTVIKYSHMYHAIILM